MEQIPFMDIKAQYASVKDEVDLAMHSVLAQTAFIQGPFAEKFNKEFLLVHGGNYGVGCCNGTSAITLALRAMHLRAGDEVLIPNNTFFGTAEPIVEMGGVPVLVDCEPGSYGMNLRELESKITSRTKGIIPVHLYGNPEPMDQIMAIARKNSLFVIEDCAQAHLAKWKGQAVGTYGDFGTFSFYPGKNLGAFGDAGFLIGREEDSFLFAKKYLDHGRSEKYLHQMFAGNYRMDGMQAAVLSAKLRHLPQWTERRREIAKAYDEAFVSQGFKVVKPRAEAHAVYHLYVIEVSNRDQVMEHLKKHGIGYGVHYPVTLNNQPAFAELGYKRGGFPVSEAAAERMISLAFYPEMSDEQAARVTSEFLKVARP